MKFKSIILLILISFHSFTAYAGVYEFKNLESLLGYPNETYFGSPENAITDLEAYTSKEDTFYKEINSYLRYFPKDYDWNGIGPDSAKLMVENIDQIFDHVPSLPSDLIIFRGLDLNFRKNISYNIGDEFIEKAYVSTSTSFKIAKYFAIEMDAWGHPKTKKAIIAYYINRQNLKGILFDQAEDEVVLKHGEKIRIMAVKTQNSAYELYLAQICAQVCESTTSSQVMEFWEKFSPN
jgi:hypothetical protein